jgi:mevalonate kinase
MPNWPIWVIICGELIVATYLLFVGLKISNRQNRMLIAENKLLTTENKLLKGVNTKIQTRVQQLEITVQANRDEIELLQKQMYQVHDWLSRLTISDLIVELTERVNEIDDASSNEPQYQSK